MNAFIEKLKAAKAEKMGEVVLKQEVEEPKPVKKPRKKKNDGN